jgi:hypothetical protein
LSTLLPLTFNIPFWIFSIAFLIPCTYHLFKNRKQVYSRAGVLIVWIGMSVSWLINQVILMF